LLEVNEPGIPSPTVSNFTIGNVVVHYYALFIIAGIVLALIIGGARLKARGVERGVVLDIALWAVPLGIIGGRIVHVLTHASDYFGEGRDLREILYIWHGGLAIYGAVAFGVFGAWIGCRFAGLRLTSFLDAVVPGLILAQGIGRWGNYFNQELFGVPTTLPWGLQITNSDVVTKLGFGPTVVYHPIFFYEFALDILGFALLLLLDRRFELRWGKLFAVYLVYYSTVRFWLEGIRIDPSEYYFGLRTFQWVSLVGIALGVWFFLRQRRKHTGLEASAYLSEPKPGKKK